MRESFEAFRVREAERVEAAWSTFAARFRSRTQRRVDAVRAAASDLFAIELPAIVVPAVSEERESFFYLFLHVGSTSEGLEPRGAAVAAASCCAPSHARAHANELMVREFDKHAGRARWDLTQRLDGVRRRFEEAMSAELQRTVDAHGRRPRRVPISFVRRRSPTAMSDRRWTTRPCVSLSGQSRRRRESPYFAAGGIRHVVCRASWTDRVECGWCAPRSTRSTAR